LIEHLSTLVDGFPGAANQTRCFAHTINIAAKAILKQFDVPKAKPGTVLDEASQALSALAKEVDSEECTEQEAWEADDEDEDDRPLDRWVDLREGLTAEEVSELDESTQPVQSTLVKVCSLFGRVLTRILTQYIAASSRVRPQELDNYTPPSMVCHSRRPPPPPSDDAARCFNALELNL